MLCQGQRPAQLKFPDCILGGITQTRHLRKVTLPDPLTFSCPDPSWDHPQSTLVLPFVFHLVCLLLYQVLFHWFLDLGSFSSVP